MTDYHTQTSRPFHGSLRSTHFNGTKYSPRFGGRGCRLFQFPFSVTWALSYPVPWPGLYLAHRPILRQLTGARCTEFATRHSYADECIEFNALLKVIIIPIPISHTDSLQTRMYVHITYCFLQLAHAFNFIILRVIDRGRDFMRVLK